MCIIIIVPLVLSLLFLSFVILSLVFPQAGRNAINELLLKYYDTPHEANDEASYVVYVESLSSTGWFVLQVVILVASCLLFLGVMGCLTGKIKLLLFIILPVLATCVVAILLLLGVSVYKNSFDTYILMPLFQRTYKSPQTIETALWNIMMIRSHCCGINNAKDFTKSAWVSRRRSVGFPPSCCKFNINVTRAHTMYYYTPNDCYSSPDQHSNYHVGCRSDFASGLHLILFYILIVAPIIILALLLIICKKIRSSQVKKKHLEDTNSSKDINISIKTNKNESFQQGNDSPTDKNNEDARTSSSVSTVSMMTIGSEHRENVTVKICNCSELQKTKPKVDIRKGTVGCRQFVTVHIQDQD